MSHHSDFKALRQPLPDQVLGHNPSMGPLTQGFVLILRKHRWWTDTALQHVHEDSRSQPPSPHERVEFLTANLADLTVRKEGESPKFGSIEQELTC